MRSWTCFYEFARIIKIRKPWSPKYVNISVDVGVTLEGVLREGDINLSPDAKAADCERAEILNGRWYYPADISPLFLCRKAAFEFSRGLQATGTLNNSRRVSDD